jgi:hypothetical protein
MQRKDRTSAGPNGIQAGTLSDDDRLADLAEILALGAIRLLTPKSSEISAAGGECSLDCSAEQSGRHGGECREDRQ